VKRVHNYGKSAVHVFANPLVGGRSLQTKCAFLAIDVIEAPEDWLVPAHRHDFFELMHPLEGSYSCTVNRSGLILHPGQTLMVRPGDMHEDATRSACKLLAVKFLLSGLHRSSQQLEIFSDRTKPSDLIFSGTREMLDAYRKRVKDEVEAPGQVTPFLLDAWTLSLFWEFLKRLERPILSEGLSHAGRPNSLEGRMLEAFQGRLNENLSVPQIAEHLGMSVSSLERACRKELRISAARAFTRFKMEEALELLKFTRAPIKEISDALGFNNPNHFSTAFSRYFGKPPSAFRALPIEFLDVTWEKSEEQTE